MFWSPDSQRLAFPLDPTTLALLTIATGERHTVDLGIVLQPLLEPLEGQREAKGLAAGLCAAISPNNALVFVCLRTVVTSGYIVTLPNKHHGGKVLATVGFPEPLESVEASWLPCSAQLLVQGHKVCPGGVAGNATQVVMDVALPGPA